MTEDKQPTRRLPPWLARAWTFLRRVFGPPVRFVYDVLRSHLKEHQGGLTAAGVAFYLSISLVPLILLGVSVAGYVIGSSERAVAVISEAVVELVPQGELLIQGLLERVVANRLEVGLIGLVALLWISSKITDAVRRALDNIFGGLARPRRWWEGRLVSLAMLVGLLGFFIGGAWVTGLFAHVATSDWSLWGMELKAVKGLARFILVLAPYLLSWLFFFLVYRLVPTTKGGARAAAVGAAVAALGLEAAKLGFSFYLAHLKSPGLYYGILTGVVLLALWAYYAAHVLLVGAEVAREITRRRRRRQAEHPPENTTPD